ncbi:MAG TPA: hypothetical protein VMK32_04420 [Burkholderiaceae bacterium]|nr:hypothetical protein [Burkholderiaceae bacterium]
MRKLLIVIALTLAAAGAGGRERVSAQNVDAWVGSYYMAPRPDDVADALAALAARGLLDSSQAEASLSGFFAEVFRANPGRVEGWIQPYVGVPRRYVIYTALWMAHSRESMAALQRISDMAPMEEGAALRVLRGTLPPSVESIPIESPATLDFLWGSFYASGSEVPVLRIIDQMKLASRRGDPSAVLIGETAQRSIAANARQHDKVLAIVKERARVADPETRARLEEIASAVEAERARK